MLRVLRAELRKLQGAKTVYWTLVVVAFVAVFAVFTQKLGNDDLSAITWAQMLGYSPQLMASYWGLLIFGLATAHLFGSEFSDGTAATMLTAPLRREYFVIAKMIVLALWIAALAVLAVITQAGGAALMGAKAFTWDAVWKCLGDSLAIAGIIYMTLPAVALISMVGRGYLAPMLFSSAVMAMSWMSFFLGWTEWIPWAMSSSVAGFMGPPEWVDPLNVGSWAILIGMFVLGLAAVIVYVNRADTSL